ncbi:MAG: anhydro-N-acetylmuramic acid kinase, partial [Candidatus Sumerlaeia bacterium]|nr:anhydro-N-acetylmuramic acid kinase [Candidatus Sumerlaeia bacterium]
MKIIGLMSGTSADGIDTALVEIHRRRQKLYAKLLAFNVYKFPTHIRQLIFRLFLDQAGSLSLTCQLNFALGKFFAQAVLELLRKSGVPPQEIKAIGSHGQTVYHLPPSMAKLQGAIASTLQIGDASVIALHTGITTVAD